MLIRWTRIAGFVCLLAAPASAQPPDHAPAHGQRAGRGAEERSAARDTGFEVVYDAQRGVRIAVGFPGVFFAAGSFYRHHAGHWQVSARPDSGWTFAAAAQVPPPIYKAHGPRPHPGPAERSGRDR